MSVVIPVPDEAVGLPLVLDSLPPVDEVILVAGGSADETVAVARAILPGVRVVRQSRSGRGNALASGFAACTGDIVVTLNADGSTDPGEVARYVDALLAGAEAAHGSRYRAGGQDLAGGWLERLGNAVLSRLVNLLLGTRFTDVTWAYTAFWRRLLPVLDLPGDHVPGLKRGRRAWGDGPEIEPLLAIRMAAQGLRLVEVCSVGYPRFHDRSRRRLRRLLQALRVVVTEHRRRRRPARRPAPARPDATWTGRHGTPRQPPAVDAPAGRESTGARRPAPRRGWETTSGSLYDTLTGVGYRSVAGHETTGGIRYRTSSRPVSPPPAGVRPAVPPPVDGTSLDLHAAPAGPPVGVRHSRIYDTGARHRIADVPDPGLNPMLRPAPPREVGGGRRRLESYDRRLDGTVIPDAGMPEPDGQPRPRRRGSTSSL